MHDAVAKFSRRKPLDDATWAELEKGMAYVQGDFSDPATYERLAGELGRLEGARGTTQNRVFYLAVAPSEVPSIVKGLCAAKLVVPPSSEADASYQRVVVEKPFGEDLASARALNRELLSCLDERQIYRIDHYLGKETVQNLLVFRFGNTIFEPLWSRQHISHVQLTVAEEIGVEGRGKFYDKIGITRDIVQNHALQILTMMAMDPPASWDADAVRDEKVKVLRALRPIRGHEVLDRTVRAQYASGTVRGDKVAGYRDEPDVDPHSKTETFVAMSLRIDNFRWGGVPFYLRSGKRLAKRSAEVALHFKPLPHRLFRDAPGGQDEPNVLVVRIQPDEGIALRFATKVPGGGMSMRNVAMDFRYGTAFGSSTPEAYERLILDAMRGEATLFTRADEVEAQWGFIDPIIEGWREHDAPVASYESGSWGPREADRLLNPGDSWRRP
jgi:glucose-6-phosphate 1-dehydrogenase